MTIFMKSIACAVLSISIGAIDVVPAAALPIAGLPSAIDGKRGIENGVEQIQFRNGRRPRGNFNRSGGGRGGNIALGIGAAIIGGIVLSEAARAEHRSSHGSDWERCARTYRSFDSETGTYTGYDGVERTCPYLR